MATAVSSSTRIATATAMLAAVLVARTSRLTISKPHALRNPGSSHLQSTVSLSRVEPPSPSSFPPRLSLNHDHDRYPSGDKKQLTHHERVKGSRRTGEHKSCLLSQIPECISANIPPRAVSASGIPRQFGGRSMRRLVGPLSAMLTQRQGPNGERKKPRHGGRDVMAGSISRGLSPLVFFFHTYSALIFWLLLLLF